MRRTEKDVGRITTSMKQKVELLNFGRGPLRGQLRQFYGESREDHEEIVRILDETISEREE